MRAFETQQRTPAAVTCHIWGRIVRTSARSVTPNVCNCTRLGGQITRSCAQRGGCPYVCRCAGLCCDVHMSFRAGGFKPRTAGGPRVLWHKCLHGRLRRPQASPKQTVMFRSLPPRFIKHHLVGIQTSHANPSKLFLSHLQCVSGD